MDFEKSSEDLSDTILILRKNFSEAIDRDFVNLDMFRRAGLRSLGPVWSRPNSSISKKSRMTEARIAGKVFRAMVITAPEFSLRWHNSIKAVSMEYVLPDRVPP